MKKTFFYKFFPSKQEELACIAKNIPHEVSRVLVEIRDIYPPLVIDHRYSWQIRHKLTLFEVASGKLVISSNDTFNHIFRCWTLNMANHVVLGKKVAVFLWDVSEQRNHKKYYGESLYFEVLPDDNYALACKDLFQNRCLGVDDEIGLFLDSKSFYFVFKLLSKAM